MAPGPGDELEAAGRGHLRASHADREQVIEVLKAAFVQGRLAKEDFDVRVGQVLASRTYADLAVVTALPAGAAASRPPQTRSRARARKPVNNSGKVAAWGACVSIPLVLVAALLLTSNGIFFVLAVVVFGMEAPVVTVIMADALAQRRSRSRRSLVKGRRLSVMANPAAATRYESPEYLSWCRSSTSSACRRARSGPGTGRCRRASPRR
jgi:DUF1707 SHOCT-like domain